MNSSLSTADADSVGAITVSEICPDFHVYPNGQ